MLDTNVLLGQLCKINLLEGCKLTWVQTREQSEQELNMEMEMENANVSVYSLDIPVSSVERTIWFKHILFITRHDNSKMADV